MNAITNMPAINANSCLTDSLESSSLRRSGRTVTNDMCKKPPAVNGMIQDVFASIAVVTDVPPMATNAPNRPAPVIYFDFMSCGASIEVFKLHTCC